MIGKKTSFYLLGAYIAGTILLIYIQYNSSRNIDSLINGNQKLIDEFRMNAQLKELEKELLAVDSKIRTLVTTGDSTHFQGLPDNFKQIDTALVELQKIADDDSADLYIQDLGQLVQQKVLRNKQI